VFRYEGLYVGLPELFYSTGAVDNYPNTDGFKLVELACSRDLREWTRVGDRQPFLGPSSVGAGAYDLTQFSPPSRPVVRGDELWFYYNGMKYRSCWEYIGEYPDGHMEPFDGIDPDWGAICLAVLRRDGFVSLTADGNGGTLLTESFEFQGSDISVNVDATGGELGVDMIREDGDAVAAAEPLSGDHTSIELSWSGGNPAAYGGESVRLRFELRDASLYSYWVH